MYEYAQYRWKSAVPLLTMSQVPRAYCIFSAHTLWLHSIVADLMPGCSAYRAHRLLTNSICRNLIKTASSFVSLTPIWLSFASQSSTRHAMSGLHCRPASGPVVLRLCALYPPLVQFIFLPSCLASKLKLNLRLCMARLKAVAGSGRRPQLPFLQPCFCL